MADAVAVEQREGQRRSGGSNGLLPGLDSQTGSAHNAQGEQAVGDKRRGHAGRPRLLTPEQDAELRGELERAEVAGEAWNSVRTAAWMSAKLGRVVRANRGRETLQRLGFSTKTPRPQHAKADVDAQDLFKKNVS